jgi:hypothetical protein
MDLALTAADNAFRSAVRAFFEKDYPREILEKVRSGIRLTRADMLNPSGRCNRAGGSASVGPWSSAGRAGLLYSGICSSTSWNESERPASFPWP